MLRRLLKPALLGTAIAATIAVPSRASAQSVFFQSCATPGVCGYVEAFFTASLLTVRVANQDAVLGSALYDVQLIFASALNAASDGVAFGGTTNATPVNSPSIGNAAANAWAYSGVGNTNVLDLASFFPNVFLEGSAVSPFRAGPGDPDNGTWLTQNGFVEFTANVSSVAGLTGNSISQLAFCTETAADINCAQGQALVVTPEPASLTLLATGLVGVAAARRRRKNRTI